MSAISVPMPEQVTTRLMQPHFLNCIVAIGLIPVLIRRDTTQYKWSFWRSASACCGSKGSILTEDAEDEELAYLDNNLQKKRKKCQLSCKLFVKAEENLCTLITTNRLDK
jgi:hypothetical protein